MRLGDPDASGRRRPEPIPGSEFVIGCDVVVSAIGMARTRSPFQALVGTAKGERIAVDPQTLQTEVPYLFAAGDVEAGPTDITRAIGAGRRAAHMIDRWLTDRPMDGFTALDGLLDVVDRTRRARPAAGLHPIRPPAT